MARLLRLHFASIGHEDARLDPLHLDFRAGSEGEPEPEPENRTERPRGVDSVLWLRNGGGKSSIINLFFSVFRPSAREFLGSSAEGKARRLEQYVRSDDLAFVVSEWDCGQPGKGRDDRRLVGQVLAWKNQRRSTDIANLRRLFFSLRVQPGALELETLPIPGLAGPSESFDALKAWLTALSHEHGAAEVVFTANQRKWAEHLERIGLDPEVFRYQLAMNQREGAADELFRFRNDAEFIHFLFEMVSDPSAANQIVRNMAAQQENLEQRPRWLLERKFLESAVVRVRAFEAATGARRDAQQNLWESTMRMSVLAKQLELRARDAREARDEAAQARDAAKQQLRLAHNERDKQRRWATGLQRFAAHLDVEDAQRQVDAHKRRTATLEREGRILDAATAYSALRRHEAKIAELELISARESEAREPLRKSLCVRGTWLRLALRNEADEIERRVRELAAALEHSERQLELASERQQSARDDVTRAQSEVEHVDLRLRERDRARERLIKSESLEHRETAGQARERWQAHRLEHNQKLEQHQQERLEARESLDERVERRQELGAMQAQRRAEAEDLAQQVEKALKWRDHLAEHSCLQEVEEDAPANPESPGLVDRLVSRSEHLRRKSLESGVEGAEDIRNLHHLSARGLLPSPMDVQRVLEQLDTAAIAAVSGAEYLAQNARPEDAAALLAHDPSRFGGIVVLDPLDDDALAPLDFTRLSGPVQISEVIDLDAGTGPASAFVALPDSAVYDPRVAQSRRSDIEAAIARRDEDIRETQAREQSFRAAADELKRFLDAHGGGRLDQLQQRAELLGQQADHARSELGRVNADIEQLRHRLDELEATLQTCRGEIRRAQAHHERLEAFIRDHERHVEDWRASKDAAKARAEAAQETIRAAQDEIFEHRGRCQSLRSRHYETQSQASALENEREAVAYFDKHPRYDGPDQLDLAQLRERYKTFENHYVRELSESRTRAEIEICRDQLPDFRKEYQHRARGLTQAEVSDAAQSDDLRDARLDNEQELAHARELASESRAQLIYARATLEKLPPRRRDADDMPSAVDLPESAAQARDAAEDCRRQAERASADAQRAEEIAQSRDAARIAHDRDAERCEGYRTRIVDATRVAQCPLLPVPSSTQAAVGESLAPQVDALTREFAQCHEAARRADREQIEAGQAVQRVAQDSAYADLKARYREQMKESIEALAELAPQLAQGLAARADIVEQSLAKLDEDRRLIVEQLLHLADQTAKILARAQSSSALPAGFQGWSGKPYLRINFRFAEGDEERRGRLEPFVDRIIERGQIPSGLDLLYQTALELAGARGFDVRILKPDTVLRPDPVPLHLMSTFSRGQQLTAAILMYCTLVHLRAHLRGRAHLRHDAGLLLLDNPLGTCSSVALLQLQRRVAQRMGVQLVYTTGIEDLEALDTLPNKIRLVNEHRDRLTGDHHVTRADEIGHSRMHVARVHSHETAPSAPTTP